MLHFSTLGSRQYVEAILAKLDPSRLHLSSPVAAVGNRPDGKILLKLEDGRIELFDHVILASHTYDALRMLKAGSGATPLEEQILSSFRWSYNETVLHSDVNVRILSFNLPVTMEVPDHDSSLCESFHIIRAFPHAADATEPTGLDVLELSDVLGC
jgi:predicted NAD/FAD-binding protein